MPVLAAQSLAEADCVLIYPLRSGVEPFEFDTLSTGCAGQRSNLHLTRGPSSMGVTAHILRTDTLVVPDVRQRRTRFHNQTLAQHSFLRQEGIKAFVGTPVRDVQSRELLGILYLDYRQPRKFSPRELHMVSSLPDWPPRRFKRRTRRSGPAMAWLRAEARGRTSEREPGPAAGRVEGHSDRRGFRGGQTGTHAADYRARTAATIRSSRQPAVCGTGPWMVRPASRTKCVTNISFKQTTPSMRSSKPIFIAG